MVLLKLKTEMSRTSLKFRNTIITYGLGKKLTTKKSNLSITSTYLKYIFYRNQKCLVSPFLDEANMIPVERKNLLTRILISVNLLKYDPVDTNLGHGVG